MMIIRITQLRRSGDVMSFGNYFGKNPSRDMREVVNKKQTSRPVPYECVGRVCWVPAYCAVGAKYAFVALTPVLHLVETEWGFTILVAGSR